MNNNFNTSIDFANQLDAIDPLASMREKFHIPIHSDGQEECYFTGNSLGLQPKSTKEYVNELLAQWQHKGVRGHFEGDFPWMPYHEFLTRDAAALVGGKPNEVVMMNSLTVNLHLMMVSFYQPEGKRTKILIEEHAFPSDHYAVESQIEHHGLDPNKELILWRPKPGEHVLDERDLADILAKHGNEIALILLPGVQYYTGQVLNMANIVKQAKAYNINVGFDLAHAVGNIELSLHEWQVDFACWCTYKYLNSGPGSVAGCFIHEKHVSNTNLNRFAGWWGHDKSTRFKMDNKFIPTATADGWQLSNPPILSLAAIRASYDTIKQAGGMGVLREKSLKLTDYLATLLAHELAEQVDCITPSAPNQRGCQLSLCINFEKTSKNIKGRQVFEQLEARGITTDWREPNVIRVAPVPLYNTYTDCHKLVQALKEILLS